MVLKCTGTHKAVIWQLATKILYDSYKSLLWLYQTTGGVPIHCDTAMTAGLLWPANSQTSTPDSGAQTVKLVPERWLLFNSLDYKVASSYSVVRFPGLGPEHDLPLWTTPSGCFHLATLTLGHSGFFPYNDLKGDLICTRPCGRTNWIFNLLVVLIKMRALISTLPHECISNQALEVFLRSYFRSKPCVSCRALRRTTAQHLCTLSQELPVKKSKSS